MEKKFHSQLGTFRVAVFRQRNEVAEKPGTELTPLRTGCHHAQPDWLRDTWGRVQRIYRVKESIHRLTANQQVAIRTR